MRAKKRIKLWIIAFLTIGKRPFLGRVIMTSNLMKNTAKHRNYSVHLSLNVLHMETLKS